ERGHFLDSQRATLGRGDHQPLRSDFFREARKLDGGVRGAASRADKDGRPSRGLLHQQLRHAVLLSVRELVEFGGKSGRAHRHRPRVNGKIHLAAKGFFIKTLVRVQGEHHHRNDPMKIDSIPRGSGGAGWGSTGSRLARGSLLGRRVARFVFHNWIAPAVLKMGNKFLYVISPPEVKQKRRNAKKTECIPPRHLRGARISQVLS